jgi:hypothetical protein
MEADMGSFAMNTALLGVGLVLLLLGMILRGKIPNTAAMWLILIGAIVSMIFFNMSLISFFVETTA